MKKVFSISLSVLMLTAMLHFSLATHYCHGTMAASKVSLSGKLASCGMEGEENASPVTGNFLKSHCCDDVVTTIGVNNDYAPSFSYVPDFFQYNTQVFIIPKGLPVISSLVFNPLYTNVSPPGELMSTRVDLSDICVFRI